MPKLTRKSVRSEIVKAGVSEDKANELLESIMSMYGASTADMVSKEDLEELKQEAVNEAMKNTPKDYKESQDYKDLLGRVQEYEKKDTIRTLTDKGVKSDKYAEMLLERLDKEKDIDEQLTAFKEEYADMFNVEQEEEPKPQFGAQPKGTMPSGKETQTFGDFWSFMPKEK